MKQLTASEMGKIGGKRKAERLRAAGLKPFSREQQALGGKRSGESKRARKASAEAQNPDPVAPVSLVEVP